MNITLNTDSFIKLLDKTSMKLKKRKGGENRMYPVSILKRWIAIDASQGDKFAHDEVSERWSLPLISSEVFGKEIDDAVIRLGLAKPLMGLSQFYAIHAAELWVKTQRKLYDNVLEYAKANEIDLTPEMYDNVYVSILPSFMFILFQSYMSAAIATDSVSVLPGLYGTEVISK